RAASVEDENEVRDDEDALVEKENGSVSHLQNGRFHTFEPKRRTLTGSRSSFMSSVSALPPTAYEGKSFRPSASTLEQGAAGGRALRIGSG
ncbi:unnamed protein product, partial [Amoebophrya sp. A120]